MIRRPSSGGQSTKLSPVIDFSGARMIVIPMADNPLVLLPLCSDVRTFHKDEAPPGGVSACSAVVVFSRIEDAQRCSERTKALQQLDAADDEGESDGSASLAASVEVTQQDQRGRALDLVAPGGTDEAAVRHTFADVFKVDIHSVFGLVQHTGQPTLIVNNWPANKDSREFQRYLQAWGVAHVGVNLSPVIASSSTVRGFVRFASSAALEVGHPLVQSGLATDMPTVAIITPFGKHKSLATSVELSTNTRLPPTRCMLLLRSNADAEQVYAAVTGAPDAATVLPPGWKLSCSANVQIDSADLFSNLEQLVATAAQRHGVNGRMSVRAKMKRPGSLEAIFDGGSPRDVAASAALLEAAVSHMKLSYSSRQPEQLACMQELDQQGLLQEWCRQLGLKCISKCKDNYADVKVEGPKPQQAVLFAQKFPEYFNSFQSRYRSLQVPASAQHLFYGGRVGESRFRQLTTEHKGHCRLTHDRFAHVITCYVAAGISQATAKLESAQQAVMAMLQTWARNRWPCARASATCVRGAASKCWPSAATTCVLRASERCSTRPFDR